MPIARATYILLAFKPSRVDIVLLTKNGYDVITASQRDQIQDAPPGAVDSEFNGFESGDVRGGMSSNLALPALIWRACPLPTSTLVAR